MALANQSVPPLEGERWHSHCRFCRAPLTTTLVDLGTTPAANAYQTPTQMRLGETYYPLHAYVCDSCKLVQLEDFQTPGQLFSDYLYFSSYSESWLEHAAAFADMAVERFGLTPRSLVMEVASNDGYLLKNFLRKRIPVLGIEPAANIAMAAQRDGIPTLVEFFGVEAARHLVRGGQLADLLIGNNVLAHVPDINDFVRGLSVVLKPDGVLVMEFPHLLNLLEKSQFDTIYHEHFSYLSILAVERIFEAHGLAIFDVDRLPTHGGSLRIYACLAINRRPEEAGLAEVRAAEKAAGLGRLETYAGFSERCGTIKRDLLRFLIDAREAGKTVAGYGAPAKGNTLLNYCGIKADLLPFTVDISPHKQGLFLPGSRIPVFDPGHLTEARPDYVLILPWNLTGEITRSMSHIRDWGGRFVVPIPALTVLD